VPCHNAEHNGTGEGHAAEYPCVVEAVIEPPQDDPVNKSCEVCILVEAVRDPAGEGNEHHQGPEQKQQKHRRYYLPAKTHIQDDDCGNKIPCRDGLQRVAVNLQFGRVDVQQVALGNHAEDKEDYAPQYNMDIEFPLAVAALEALAE